MKKLLPASLDNEHSSGVDHISNAIVKVSEEAIVPILTMLVNQLIQRGVFPTYLRYATLLI